MTSREKNAYDQEEIALRNKRILEASIKLAFAIDSAKCPGVNGFAIIPGIYSTLFQSILLALGAAGDKENDEIVDSLEMLLNAIDIRHGGDEMMPGERVKLMWLPEVK
jgi:hypothetical protein